MPDKEQAANVIEQHVEKGVLAVCVLLLLYGVYHWVLSSPRQLEIITGRGIQTQQVPPHQADQKLLDAAKLIQTWNLESNRPALTHPKYAEIIVRLQDANNQDPNYGDPNLYNYRLAMEIGYPRRPVELDPNLEAGTAKVQLADLKDVPKPLKPVVQTRLELPRRLLVGSDPSKLRDLGVAHVVGEYPYRDLANKWRERLKGTTEAGLNLHVLVFGVEAQRQARSPTGDWGPQTPVAGAPPLDKDGKPVIVPELTSLSDPHAIRKLIEDFDAKYEESVLMPDFGSILSTGKWVSWRVNLPALGGLSAEQPGGAKTGEVPTLTYQRLTMGKILTWVHDTGLQEGQIYRYRLRLKLISPLLTYTTDVRNPADARETVILTDWSEWSEEVFLPRATEFFVRGVDPGTGAVSVDMFSQLLGQRVQEKLNVLPGQAINDWADKTVVNPADPNGQQRVTQKVSFRTDCVVVGYSGRQVVRGGKAEPTVEVMVLDDRGELKRRTRVDDLPPNSVERARYEALLTEVKGGGPRPVSPKPPGT
jgi:hypothetical protein